MRVSAIAPTTEVYFNVFRNASFSEQKKVIPFHGALLNVGQGMDVRSGVFTAPVNGVYAFHFDGVRSFFADRSIQHQNGAVKVGLYHNGKLVASAEEAAHEDIGSLSVNSILHLRAGDSVEMVLLYGILHDSVHHMSTRFSGALLRDTTTATSG